MAIAAYSEPEPTRRPGDFARHPDSGAPYVTSLTETRQPKGNKPELLAKARERGLLVTDKTKVDELRTMLGPEPATVMYGRPSSLGKQIENLTNLQKWSERATALGIFLAPELLADLAQLPAEQRNLDDKAARKILDAIAVQAKNAAQAHIAAERGTHTHELAEDFDNEADWIERAKRGEELGIPLEVQRSLVDAWEQMLAEEGIEILAVEAKVVDDEWRQAGSLDRIGRLTRPRDFEMPDGTTRTLPAGWVGVVDIKTGRIRIGNDGHPDHWLGYAVQIACYAKSKPYDPDTGKRGEWPWPIDQEHGIIAHLDVLAAMAGAPTCRLVLVDLEAGRHAGDLCVAGREWEKRRDVFSRCEPAVPLAAEEPPTTPDPPADVMIDLTATVDSYDARKAALLERYQLLNDEQKRAYLAVKPADTSDLDAVQAALDQVDPFAQQAEPVATPRPSTGPINFKVLELDDGERATAEEVADLEAAFNSLPHDRKMICAAITAEARDAKTPISVTALPTKRRWHIARAIVRALHHGLTYDQLLCAAAIVATPEQVRDPANLGELLGTYTLEQADSLYDAVDQPATATAI